MGETTSSIVALLGDVPATERRLGSRQAAVSPAHSALARHRRADPADLEPCTGSPQRRRWVRHGSGALGGLLCPPHRHSGHAAGHVAPGGLPEATRWISCRDRGGRIAGPLPRASHPGEPTPAAIAAVLLFLGFHLGIGLTMRIGLFAWISALAWVVFLPASVWRDESGRAETRSKSGPRCSHRGMGASCCLHSLMNPEAPFSQLSRRELQLPLLRHCCWERNSDGRCSRPDRLR